MGEIKILKMVPTELAEEKCKITSEYVDLAELKTGIEKKKAEWWKVHRPDFKSDKSTEREWDLTNEGLEEKEISNKMKAKLMTISSINSLIRVRENELRGQW